MFSTTCHNQGSTWDFKGQMGRNRLKANGLSGLSAMGNGGIKFPNVHREHTGSGGK